VSFDVFFLGFVAGEPSAHGGAQMREVLARHISKEDGPFLQVLVGDGEAHIQLHDSRMMANHISGRDPWDLLVQGARAANWVIRPAGGPIFLTQPGQLEELPAGLYDDVVVVESGADLLAVIESR
jgi:hypothetical protein